jgi:hypothetical protein
MDRQRQPYLTYRPARLHRLAKSIPGLLKRLQIQALKGGGGGRGGEERTYLSRDPETEFVKLLRSPQISSEESIPPAYVAWWAGMTNRVVVPARQNLEKN